ncbi:MAG: DNA helicase Rep [Gammaproteobacteria bacterium]
MPTTGLNKAQSAAVKYTDGPLLVLAGAGSGKTRVITEKIAHLVERLEMSPRNIAAVTFTNKAAREMKERVGRLMGSDGARGLMVSTFHTLGLTILRREARTLGLRPGFSIYDGRDAQALIGELMKREAMDKEYVQKVQWQISLWKNANLSPEQVMSTVNEPLEVAAAAAYGAYQQQLRAYNAVDLDDMIGLPVKLFTEHPEVRERWQNRIRYLLVDEYQDTNASQYELVKQLVGVRRALTVVGDDDQSIYAWRGARPENLAQLQTDFPDLKVVKLEQNYRSTARILKAANTLIDNNPHVFEKRLWSELGLGDEIRVVECPNEQAEAERVVTGIVHHRFTARSKHGDYAILFRGNHQARLFEKVLREQGMPYVLAGGQSFFDNAEVKDLMAYLRLLTNPTDDGAFLRVANVPKRGIGAGTLEKLATYANRRGACLMDAVFELGLEQDLTGRGLNALRQFADWMRTLHQKSDAMDPVTAVRTLVNESGYEGWLYEQYDEPVAERRVKNVNDLVGWFGRLAEKEDGAADLSELVAKVTLLDMLDRADSEEAGDRITLMTLHAAKGLEFPHVYLVGFEENILPHRTSIEEDSVEEERRLAYVGITRAQKTLTITLCKHRRRYGELESCDPSRFLAELPEDDLVWEGGRRQLDPVEKKERGKAHLANLRELLS